MILLVVHRERMGFAVLWVNKIEDFDPRFMSEGNTKKHPRINLYILFIYLEPVNVLYFGG